MELRVQLPSSILSFRVTATIDQQQELTMQNVDTLLHARWVVPIVPREIVHEHYSVAINGGKIVAILPTSDAKIRYDSPNIIELPDHVLLPGLVNAHTHSPMALFRGMADDMLLMDWLQKHIWPSEAAMLNPEFILDGMRLAMAEMIRGGTTCFNEHYFYPEITSQIVAEIGMRARVGLIVLPVTTAWAKDADECFAKAEAVLAAGSPSDLISYSMAPHSPYMCDNEMLIRVKDLSDKHQLPIHMHVHEPASEIRQSLDTYAVRPINRLQHLGLVSPMLQCVHFTQFIDEDLDALRESGAHIIHCPESNLKLNSGYCPVQKFLDAGINVALGTDGAASNNDLDMFGEMRTAAFIGKTIANDPTATSAFTVLEMATLGGAKALHLADHIGSIEAGKAADLIAVDLRDLNTQPVYNPVSQLVYACNSRQVIDVWIAGTRQLQRGKLTKLDKESILNNCKERLARR
ncbi:MAG: TRZ/ATZ family hydrolase [Pseudomonadota bacterium]|nr:TRZ/ATZ family hydrolase [Pseudomonadota bacterium]